jgi:hypothetical protein
MGCRHKFLNAMRYSKRIAIRPYPHEFLNFGLAVRLLRILAAPAPLAVLGDIDHNLLASYGLYRIASTRQLIYSVCERSALRLDEAMNSSKVDSLGRGLGAGLVATVALAIMLVAKQAIGLMPQLDLVSILARALGFQSLAAGWTAHFVVGVLLWGPLFVWADRKMFFAHWINGLLFASVVWLGVMLVIMPLAGEGMFGLGLGIATPTLTLFLHWVYGTVLGSTCGAIKSGQLTGAVAHRMQHAYRARYPNRRSRPITASVD